jgi:hypothetical protein
MVDLAIWIAAGLFLAVVAIVAVALLGIFLESSAKSAGRLLPKFRRGPSLYECTKMGPYKP